MHLVGLIPYLGNRKNKGYNSDVNSSINKSTRKNNDNDGNKVNCNEKSFRNNYLFPFQHRVYMRHDIYFLNVQYICKHGIFFSELGQVFYCPALSFNCYFLSAFLFVVYVAIEDGFICEGGPLFICKWGSAASLEIILDMFIEQ